MSTIASSSPVSKMIVHQIAPPTQQQALPIQQAMIIENK